VSFDLPDCCLKSWDVGRRDINFHYAGRDVRIVFRILGGRVDVVTR